MVLNCGRSELADCFRRAQPQQAREAARQPEQQAREAVPLDAQELGQEAAAQRPGLARRERDAAAASDSASWECDAVARLQAAELAQVQREQERARRAAWAGSYFQRARQREAARREAARAAADDAAALRVEAQAVPAYCAPSLPSRDRAAESPAEP